MYEPRPLVPSPRTSAAYTEPPRDVPALTALPTNAKESRLNHPDGITYGSVDFYLLD